MNTFEAYDLAIGIERRLSNMYHRFSTLFKENSQVHNFWTGIASHEKGHSETLTLSKGYLLWNHPRLKHKKISLVRRSDIKELESLQELLKEYERRAKREKISLQEALDMLLKIENSELNHLYNRLIRLSGFKLSRKPDIPPSAGTRHRSMYEHMKVIKSFMDKYYRGSLPPICVEDFAEGGAPPVLTTSEFLKGKIAEIIPEMSYGFIEGEDRKRYMFLPEDLSRGDWKDAEVNKFVEFKVMALPWGLKANNIIFRH